ncbi:DNA polymerase [Arthrospira platensis SPKY2]
MEIKNFRLIDVEILNNNKDIEDLILQISRETNNKEEEIIRYGIDLETRAIDENIEGGALIHTNAKVRLIQLYQLNWKRVKIIDINDIEEEKIKELLIFLETQHYKNIELIAHNAMYEYIILRENYNIILNNIKDTYTALCTLNVSQGWKEGLKRGRGLADLARSLFNIQLDKTEQNSNWSNLKLSDQQYQYAALDVGAPKNCLNEHTKQYLKSILIEGYIILEKVCKERLNEDWSFDLDQKCVSIMAEMKFNGWPINNALKEILIKEVKKKKEESILELCRNFNMAIKYDPFIDDYIVPEQILTIFNNPKELVKKINKRLKSLGKNLFIETAESKILLDLLKEVDNIYDNNNKQIEDIEELTAEEKDKEYNYSEKLNEKEIKKIDIKEKRDIIQAVITYKKYLKLYEFIEKYLNCIDKKTGKLHLTILPVGTSTGRCASRDSQLKINAQNIPNKTIQIQCEPQVIMGNKETNISNKYKINVSLRNLFTAKEGQVFGSFDYGSQELVLVAYSSREEEMIKTFEEKINRPKIINPLTNEYVTNPNADLHIKAAKYIFSDLLEVEDYQLDKIAKSPDKNGVIPRHIGKIVNFSIIYGKTVSSFAQDFKVSIEEAEDMVNNYLKGFPNLNKWLKENNERAKIEKLVRTSSGRLISIWESNAKGIQNKEAVGRKGVNALIQGEGANMTKLACVYTRTRVPEITPLSIVHDEYNCLLPGTIKIVDLKEDKGLYKPIFEISQEAKEAAKKVIDCMEDAGRDIISTMGYKKEEILITVSSSLAPYWEH